MTEKKILFKLTALTLFVLFTGIILIYITGRVNLLPEIILGYITSFAIFSSAFISIHWASKKTLKTLMIVVLGGMSIRFVIIGILFFFIMHFTELNIKYFVIFFITFYLLYQTHEIYFISKKLPPKKKRLKTST